MPNCSISNCKNYGYREKGDISFHHFPENPFIRKKWIEATGRKYWHPTKFSTICSTHFTKSSFTVATGKMRKLRGLACPTIDILQSKSSEEEPRQTYEEKKTPSKLPPKKELLKQMAAKSASNKPFGQCRSCLNLGYHKEITDYREEFINCLNLQLSKNAKLPNMICTSCVRQLNHASEFRSMVVESERELLSVLDSNIEFIEVSQHGDGQEKERIRKGSKEENRGIQKIQEYVKDDGAKGERDYDFCSLSNFQNEDDYYSNENDATILENEDDNYILIIGDEGLETDGSKYNMLQKKDKTSRNSESEDDATWLPTSDDPQSGDDWQPGTIQDRDSITPKRKSIKFKETESQTVNEKISKENKLADSLLKLLCPQCDYKTSNKNFLETHIQVHDAKISYKCNFCPYITTSKRSLTEHTLIHTGERPHACSVCDKKFSKKSILKTHMILHTGEKPFACKFCHKTFANSSNKTTHEKIHKEISFACKLCSKTFKGKVVLKKHVRTHFRKQRHTCNICGNKVLSLQVHMLRHVKEKPLSCDLCSYKCFQNTDLRTHKLASHSSADDLPHACGICGKTFLRMSRLNEHIRLHTGERPVACKFCKRKFRRREEVNTHMKLSHASKLRACHKCGLKFDNIAHFNRHQTGECEGR